MKWFAIVLLLFVLSVFQVSAQTRTKTNLNFRSAASAGAEVMSVIPQGAQLQVLVNYSDGWSLAMYRGKLGYVRRSYLWNEQQSSSSSRSSNASRIDASNSTSNWNSPVVRQAPSHPAGATARCVDGSYSYSQHRQGTCSHHGGVAQWL